VSELTTRLREILAAFAASDPGCKRFGAAQHRYQLLPPVERVDLELPDDYREYVTRLSAGGVGPYYGLVPADRVLPVDAPGRITTWRRALPIAHLGCGYAALLVLDGAAAGQVWLDAHALGIVEPIRASFTAFYLDWVDRLANHRWLDGFVPAGMCAITAALSGYLAMHERQLGLEPGTIAGDQLRYALGKLGPGAIEATVSELGLFEPGDRVDPCATCARALQGLVEQGLRADVVAPGLPPLPCRERTSTR
jgi:hypothetical protein